MRSLCDFLIEEIPGVKLSRIEKKEKAQHFLPPSSWSSVAVAVAVLGFF